MGGCSVYNSLQADSKLKFAAWPTIELAVTCRWPTLAQRNRSELSHMAGAVDDSTINTVVVIIIIISQQLKTISNLYIMSILMTATVFIRQHCISPPSYYSGRSTHVL